MDQNGFSSSRTVIIHVSLFWEFGTGRNGVNTIIIYLQNLAWCESVNSVEGKMLRGNE